jgi:ribosomal protein S18 acetylase RimI-like enzyme
LSALIGDELAIDQSIEAFDQTLVLPLVLERSWVGRRVTVRRVVAREADGRLRYSDVVGELRDLDPDTAVVEGPNGPVEIPLALVTAARPALPSTADELALEAVTARGLRPAETSTIGGWVLRADHGFTRRANSVSPLRAPGRPLDEALERAGHWYADRGLPLRIQVPVEARRLLDAGLGERGWSAEELSHVLVARLGDRPNDGPTDPAAFPARVAVDAAPDDDWLGVYRGGAGRTPAHRALLTRHDDAAFASVRVDGRTVAVGRGTVDEGWLGLTAVEVEPTHRRQGLARAITAALWQWGRVRGARRTYLSVRADNAAAIALYESAGYWRHHDYQYRVAP